MKQLTGLAFMLAAVCAPLWAHAAPATTDSTPDEYGAVAAPLTSQPGDAESGAIIMSTKSRGNCISCHQISALAETPFHGEVGPVLDGVADRWEEAELRGILVDAKNVFPGTMMPSYFKTTGYIRPAIGYTKQPAIEPLPPLLKAQDIEDVVAFLMTLKEE